MSEPTTRFEPCDKFFYDRIALMAHPDPEVRRVIGRVLCGWLLKIPRPPDDDQEKA